eukprot:Pompholyxophrys_punicea_v1_NODE_81_length_3705_cov_14.177534.p4 type:complete len:112 gc:universal NODE_81_length_3705_cov_14.177534:2824-2489(-)
MARCDQHVAPSTCFNGHRRVHGLKFQSLLTPDGLIHTMFGPVVGRRHDAFMLRESGLVENLTAMNQALGPDGPFVTYADKGYHLQPYVIVPYIGAHLTQAQVQFYPLFLNS